MYSSWMLLLLFLHAICRDDPVSPRHHPILPLQSVNIVHFIGFPDGKRFFILRKKVCYTFNTLNIKCVIYFNTFSWKMSPSSSPSVPPFSFLRCSLHTLRCLQYGWCMSSTGFRGGGRVKTLICSICQLSWQTYSHPWLFSAANGPTWQLLHKTPKSVAVLAPELVPAATGPWCAVRWLPCRCTRVTISHVHPEASSCRPSSAPFWEVISTCLVTIW